MAHKVADGVDVAPHVGAWIETAMIGRCLPTLRVAPHVGAWIETVVHHEGVDIGMSLPMWERGLKLTNRVITHSLNMSLPMWERGLKPVNGLFIGTQPCRSPCGSVD